MDIFNNTKEHLNSGRTEYGWPQGGSMLPRIESRISRSLHVQLSDFLLRASRRWIRSDCHHVQWKAQVSVQWPQFPIKSVLAAIRWEEFCSEIWTDLATIKRGLHCRKLPALWYPWTDYIIYNIFLLLGSWKPYVARLYRISQKKQREGIQPLCLIYRPVNKNKRTQLGRFSRQKDVFRERVLLCVCLSGSVADRRHRMWWNADQTGCSSVGHPTWMSDLQHFKEADGTSKK